MTLIKALARSLFLRTLGVGVLGYIAADFLLPQEALNALLAALTLCFAAAVSIMYFPVAWPSFLAPTLQSRDRLVLGIVLSWGSRLILSAMALLSILAGNKLGFIFNQTEYFGYVFTMVLIAAVFHITAPLVDEAEAPRRNWRAVIIALVVGSVIAGFVAGVGYIKLTGGGDGIG